MKLVSRFFVYAYILFLKLQDVTLRRGRNLFLPLKKVPGKVTKLLKHTRRGIRHEVGSLKKSTLVFPHRKRQLPFQALQSYQLTFRSKLKYFFLGSLFSFMFFFIPLVLLIFLNDLPNPQELTLRQIPQTTKIFDRHGVLLDEIYATQNRTLITLSDIPIHLQQATLAIEDKNFYNHPGFDIPAIIRALRENLSKRSFQGGSTITQQLIKSSMLTPAPRIDRKVKEIFLAFWAERIYSKREILEMYFNQIPYGGTAWGVEAASEVYFGKHVKDLTLAESAFLAGITAAPTTYSPYGKDPSLWKKRQKEVLSRMVTLKYITKEQAAKAEKAKLHFRPRQDTLRAPHFVEYVKEYLINTFGLAMVERGGLKVTTSLDLTIQNYAEKVVKEEVDKASYLNLTNGAVLITNPATGEILAMVGSRDFFDPNGGNVNVTTSLRQPGSAIKPVTYSAALMKGFTAATILDDAPITYAIPGSEPYTPQNYDGRFYGRLPLRLALANSLNIPAVKTLNHIGIEAMVDLAKDMGITTWDNPKNYGLSITLGAAEVTMVDMATVFGVFANGGKRVDTDPILRISDYKGNTLAKKQDAVEVSVLKPGIAFIIADILADNTARTLAFGQSSELVIPGHTVSVKTGTTDNKRDNWTVGFTDSFVVVTWVGNNDNTPMSQTLASGVTGAAPIWHRVMTWLLEKEPEKSVKMPPPPPDVVEKQCLSRREYFLVGTENSVSCDFPQPTSPQEKESRQRLERMRRR